MFEVDQNLDYLPEILRVETFDQGVADIVCEKLIERLLVCQIKKSVYTSVRLSKSTSFKVSSNTLGCWKWSSEKK